MLAANSTIERLVINNTDMTERGFTAVVSVLREGNNPIRELSIGFQLLRSREVGKGDPPPLVSERALLFKQASCRSFSCCSPPSPIEIASRLVPYVKEETWGDYFHSKAGVRHTKTLYRANTDAIPLFPVGCSLIPILSPWIKKSVLPSLPLASSPA